MFLLYVVSTIAGSIHNGLCAQLYFFSIVVTSQQSQRDLFEDSAGHFYTVVVAVVIDLEALYSQLYSLLRYCHKHSMFPWIDGPFEKLQHSIQTYLYKQLVGGLKVTIPMY